MGAAPGGGEASQWSVAPAVSGWCSAIMKSDNTTPHTYLGAASSLAIAALCCGATWGCDGSVDNSAGDAAVGGKDAGAQHEDGSLTTDSSESDSSQSMLGDGPTHEAEPPDVTDAANNDEFVCPDTDSGATCCTNAATDCPMLYCCISHYCHTCMQ